VKSQSNWSMEVRLYDYEDKSYTKLAHPLGSDERKKEKTRRRNKSKTKNVKRKQNESMDSGLGEPPPSPTSNTWLWVRELLWSYSGVTFLDVGDVQSFWACLQLFSV
jgi:hypothetical protein